MEFLTPAFFSALLGIVVIDLVLAGDNAIVIALAARKLPPHLRKRAIVWGTFGAIATRTALTLAVVWLLKIPGLLFAGGLALVWIACKLLVPEEHHDGEEKVHSASTFWGAMRTIVVADTIMGLDNVLAVAGAAHGSFLLVTLGLLISIPIVIWGSTLVLRLVERHPSVVFIGAGVLAWTAAKMMTHEPLLASFLTSAGALSPVVHALTVVFVLGFGMVMHHRQRERRIAQAALPVARTADSVRGQDAAAQQQQAQEQAMMNVLVPISESRNSRHAVEQVIKEFRRDPAVRVHLLHVDSPLSRHVVRFVSRKVVDDYHRDSAEKVLRPARELLDQAGVPYSVEVLVGHRAELIALAAQRLRCDHIVMATARKNSLTRMLESSVTNKVMELTTVPVEVVAGESVSNLERWGLPAGIAAVGLLALALD